MARILGHVLGRRVKMPMPLVLRAARMQGVAPFEASGFVRYVEDHRQSAVASGALTGDVLKATGTPPQSLEATARRSADRPAAHRRGRPAAAADAGP